MDDTVEIRLGPLAVLKWAGWALLFFVVGLVFMSVNSSMAEDAAISRGLGWFLLAWGAVFSVLALRAYNWLRAGKVMLTLSPEGLWGHPTRNVRIPWTQVTSVRRMTRSPSTFALATQSFWLSHIVSTSDPFRHDAYEVKLDWDLAKKGVKGEHALGVGFDIIPALMSFSSARVARSFARWLPPERCIDFENRADPQSTQEFVERLAQTRTAVDQRLDNPLTPLMTAISGDAPSPPAQPESDTPTSEPGSNEASTEIDSAECTPSAG